MTQRGSWMVIYPLFKWSPGVQGGKPALLFGLPPGIDHPQPACAFDNIALGRFAYQCILHLPF